MMRPVEVKGAMAARTGSSSITWAVSAPLMTNGWVVGAGLAYAFTPQWSVRVEYDYMGFTNRTVQYPITTTGPVEFTNQNLQTILAGVDYRFSGP